MSHQKDTTVINPSGKPKVVLIVATQIVMQMELGMIVLSVEFIPAKVARKTNLFVLWGNPQPRSDPPRSQNGTMAKDAWRVRKVYWRRERAYDKTRVRVECVVCIAGAFIGWDDNLKGEYITRGEMTEIW